MTYQPKGKKTSGSQGKGKVLSRTKGQAGERRQRIHLVHPSFSVPLGHSLTGKEAIPTGQRLSREARTVLSTMSPTPHPNVILPG